MHNLSDYDPATIPSATGLKFGLVVSEWNQKITRPLLEGAQSTLLKNGANKQDIIVQTVPGSFELVYGAAQMVRSGLFDAIIAIGCVIRGDTPHFDYICQGTTEGLARLNTQGDIPVIYGLLTCNNMEQAQDRAGGMLGNKGDECAVTAIKMADFKRKLNNLAAKK